MFNYFIDTADCKYITSLWEKIKKNSSQKAMLGVTTNPNAFFKTGDLSLKQWVEKSKELSNIICEIREDYEGELHIQFPNSNIDEKYFKKFIDILPEFSNNNKVKLCIKIPPFQNALNVAEKYKKNYNLNVTGTADASTALMALSYGIKYLSIIPGRMEEQGLNAKSHVAFIQKRKNKENYIITGSMRTLEGLKWCVEYGTIPTVGTKVWDQITKNNIEDVFNYKDTPENRISIETKFGPFTSIVNNDLSNSFFNEMDSKGNNCFNDLINY
jgi:transaldolase